MDRPDGYDALPKRFKDYIRKLEYNVGMLQGRLPKTEPTNVCIKEYDSLRGVEAKTYLADNAAVEFTVGKERFVAQRKADGLEVRTEWNGLMVRPEVTNVITVVTRERNP